MCRNCRLLQYFSPYILANFSKMALSFNNNMYLYLCGTKAHNPRNQVVYASLTSLGGHSMSPVLRTGSPSVRLIVRTALQQFRLRVETPENCRLFISTAKRCS